MTDLTIWAWPIQLARLIASIPSIIGASYIIQHVLLSEKRRKRAFTRILLAMSIMDLIFALTSVFSSSITPKEVKVPYHSLSIGSWTTCQAFGFLGHGASLSSVLYNASLSLYYVLTIRDGWTDWRIHQSKVEPLLHVIPLLIGWSIAIAALPLNLYNPTFVGCGIISYPPACESPLRPTTICERGKHADIYRLAFLDIWVWAVFVVLVISMLLIYSKLAKIDRATPKVLQQHRHRHQHQKKSLWSFQVSLSSSSINSSPVATAAAAAAGVGGGIGSGSAATFNNSSSQHLQQAGVMSSSSTSFRQTPAKPKGQQLQQQQQEHEQPQPRPRRSRSLANLNRLKHQFAVQALLYALAFFMTFLFDTVALILRATHMTRLLSLFIFLANVFLPLQGFWNAFIYIRPRYLRYRRKQQQEQERQQQQEQRHVLQQRAEASALAHAARLAAQRGLAFLHALSAKAEDDEDEAEEEEEKQEEKLEDDEFISGCDGGGFGCGAHDSDNPHSSTHDDDAVADAATDDDAAADDDYEEVLQHAIVPEEHPHD